MNLHDMFDYLNPFPNPRRENNLPNLDFKPSWNYGNTSGWQCPKCGNVYAPMVHQCYKCNNKELKGAAG